MRLSAVIPIFCLVGIGVILSMYLWQLGSGQKSVGEIPSVLIGRPAPIFNLPPLTDEGTRFSTESLKNRVSLVNIWASWCPPCRAEHPSLMTLAKRGVEIFGINYKDRKESALKFLRDLGNPYRAIGVDTLGQTAIDWGIYGYPETFVVDREGHIRYRHVGPLSTDDISNTIIPLLKKLEK